MLVAHDHNYSYASQPSLDESECSSESESHEQARSSLESFISDLYQEDPILWDDYCESDDFVEIDSVSEDTAFHDYNVFDQNSQQTLLDSAEESYSQNFYEGFNEQGFSDRFELDHVEDVQFYDEEDSAELIGRRIADIQFLWVQLQQLKRSILRLILLESVKTTNGFTKFKVSYMLPTENIAI